MQRKIRHVFIAALLLCALGLTVWVHSLTPHDPAVREFARKAVLGRVAAELALIDAARWTGLGAFEARRGDLLMLRGAVTGNLEDWVLARRTFLEAAWQGSAAGAFAYGKLALLGLGGPQDRPAAVRYFRLAALGGHIPAHRMLTQIHLSPHMEFYDPGAAERWAAHALRLGDHEALRLLLVLRPAPSEAA